MQTFVRSLFSLIVGAFLLSLQAPAFAVDYFVKNDSMGETFQGQIATAEIISDEIYAATFTLPSTWQLPVELQGVRVLMVDGSDSSKTYCGRFTVEVWEESNATAGGQTVCPYAREKDPGAVIYSMSDQFQSNPIGYEVSGDSSNWQDLRFEAVNTNQSLGVTINPVMLNSRTVRVGIKALDNNCSTTANANTFPLMVTDDDGVSADNFLYGTADFCSTITGTIPPPKFYYWKDFAQYFQTTPGDFVMRLIFDRPDQGGGDVGVDAGFDAGKDTGSDASTDSGPDASVDTGSDIGQSDIGSDAMSVDTGSDAMSVDIGSDAMGVDLGDPPDTTWNDTATQALAITSVSPSTLTNDQSTNIAIVGRGFEAGAQVMLGADAIGVTETRSGLIKATVPEGFATGVYDVIVANPGGDTAVLADGLEVQEPGSGTADTGSIADSGGSADAGADAQQSSSGSGAAGEGCGCRTVDGQANTPGHWAWVGGLFALLLVGVRRRCKTLG
jgi:MYXO-CTERM domain-containing protein